MVPFGDTTRCFGAVHFGAAQLGNRLRTTRLVALADQVARHPGGTLPFKLQSPAALKAAYRLMDRREVTHAAVLAPHRAWTLQQIEQHLGPLLVIHDATELDFSGLDSVVGLGYIGNGGGRGYLCQNSLVVDPARREVVGLVNQVLYCRPKVPKKEAKPDSRKRENRESRLWLRGTEGLPEDPRLVDVADRGADTTEFIEHELRSHRRFVIRSQHDRQILVGHEDASPRQRLRPTLRTLPVQGSKSLRINAKDGQPARDVKLVFRWAAVRIVPPRQARGEHGRKPLPVWVVHVQEVDPPKGTERLEWFLLTNEPVKSLSDALRVVDWYECRWMVEEYHKAKKTGCGIEDLQFTTQERLQPMIALLSVVALTLLNLRDASRHPDAAMRPATEVVAADYVEVLNAWRNQRVDANLSIQEFFYALARLGGHQNRRRGKPPGWLVLWRGWITLHAMVLGANAIRRKKPGGS
jgi:hypothetical protein